MPQVFQVNLQITNTYCSYIYIYNVSMLVGFTTTHAISAYHHLKVWVRISIRARCTTFCDKVSQWLVTGSWLSLSTLVSFTNKTDRHDITGLLLKVVLNTITPRLVFQKRSLKTGFIVCNSKGVTLYRCYYQGSSDLVKTRRHDFSLSWHKDDVRENLGDFQNLACI